MMTDLSGGPVVLAGLAALLTWLVPASAIAHCDTLDGPVVLTARAALDRGDVTPVLKWVAPEHEAEVREAFDRAVSVRRYGEDARSLADLYFFETVVRIHRSGEGEPYTGLKPAGSVDPGVAAADRALESGNPDELVADLAGELSHRVLELFEEVVSLKAGADTSVEAGRAYVAAYVQFVHTVEQLHGLAARGSAAEHGGGGHGH